MVGFGLDYACAHIIIPASVNLLPIQADFMTERVKAVVINPRRACAARVTVLVPYTRPCQSVCLSVTTFSASTRNEGTK